MENQDINLRAVQRLQCHEKEAKGNLPIYSVKLSLTVHLAKPENNQIHLAKPENNQIEKELWLLV